MTNQQKLSKEEKLQLSELKADVPATHDYWTRYDFEEIEKGKRVGDVTKDLIEKALKGGSVNSQTKSQPTRGSYDHARKTKMLTCQILNDFPKLFESLFAKSTDVFFHDDCVIIPTDTDQPTLVNQNDSSTTPGKTKKKLKKVANKTWQTKPKPFPYPNPEDINNPTKQISGFPNAKKLQEKNELKSIDDSYPKP